MFKWLTKSVDELDGKDATDAAVVAGTVLFPHVGIPCLLLYGVAKAVKPTGKAIGYVAKQAFKKRPPKPVPPPTPPTLEELVQAERDTYMQNLRIIEKLPLTDEEKLAAAEEQRTNLMHRITELLG